MKKPWSKEKGQALLLVVLSMPLLLGFFGFAVDAGMLFRARQILQTAADSASVAGAQEIVYADWSAAALAAAVQNGITNGSNGATVTVNHPPKSGPYTGSPGYVEVIVSQARRTYFMSMLTGGTTTVSARSVASSGPSHNCFYTLGTSGTDINVTGILASLNVPNCGIVDNSSSGSALSLTGLFDSVSAGTIAVVGGASPGFLNSINCSATATCPTTGVAPTPDPLAGVLADPAIPGGCAAKTNITTSITLSQGCWNGLNLNAGSINFNPGLYIINGDLNFNAALLASGTGVTFYVTGAINFNGINVFNLSAPTTGTYNGLLFFGPPTNTNTVALTSGISLSTLNGIIYFPGAPLSFNGLAVVNLNNSIIVKSFSFTGIGAVNDYAMINPNTPLTGTRVVE